LSAIGFFDPALHELTGAPQPPLVGNTSTSIFSASQGGPIKLPRRAFLRLVAGTAAFPAVTRIATAQSYPSRPLHFIVGFPSGGAADITARVVGQWMSEQLGQSVIIENKPGAATNVALQAVLAAPADGYTFGYISSSATINPSLYAKLPFDVALLAEFVPGYEVNSFAGVTMKAGTAPDIIERLNRVINAGLADPHLAARLGELGAIPLPFTPAEFGAYMAKEEAKWAKVVRAANIRIE
jgi:tripartite-type tricarboxylate transporter receptor subunit TctC